MTWSNRRRSELPRNWDSIRARILRRDPICRLHLDGICTVTSTEVDHIGDRHNHADTNLRGVCHDCHAKRTQAQARAAIPRRVRPTEPHPGRL